MIKINCDYCKGTPTTEKTLDNGGVIPEGWITLKVESFISDLPDKTLCNLNHILLHFCCKDCMIDFFFKAKF